MSSYLVLEEHINSLIRWLKRNTGVALPPIQEKRVAVLLRKIKQCEAIDEGEVLPAAPSTPPLIFHKEYFYFLSDIESGLAVCKACLSRVGKNNLIKHARRCSAFNASKGAELYTLDICTTECDSQDYPDSNQDDDSDGIDVVRSNNSRLDGSLGHYPYRETGKFGSFPSYDNYREESTL